MGLLIFYNSWVISVCCCFFLLLFNFCFLVFFQLFFGVVLFYDAKFHILYPPLPNDNDNNKTINDSPQQLKAEGFYQTVSLWHVTFLRYLARLKYNAQRRSRYTHAFACRRLRASDNGKDKPGTRAKEKGNMCMQEKKTSCEVLNFVLQERY